MKKYFLLFCIFLFVIYGFVEFKKAENKELFLTYIVDLNEKELCFYWKDSNNENYNNFENLKKQFASK